MASHEKYLQDLKQWLHDTSDSPLEEMSDFFTKRLEGYEEHMSIWKNPDMEVTGVDLCQSMLDQLLKKHPDKRLTAVCQDYFKYDFGHEKWDAVISFESLHHFLPERKKTVLKRL